MDSNAPTSCLHHGTERLRSSTAALTNPLNSAFASAKSRANISARADALVMSAMAPSSSLPSPNSTSNSFGLPCATHTPSAQSARGAASCCCSGAQTMAYNTCYLHCLGGVRWAGRAAIPVGCRTCSAWVEPDRAVSVPTRCVRRAAAAANDTSHLIRVLHSCSRSDRLGGYRVHVSR